MIFDDREDLLDFYRRRSIIEYEFNYSSGGNAMKNNVVCLRCNRGMNHIRTEKLQFGQTGWILGDLPNLVAGAMEVDIYSCPECRKVEFFLTDTTEEGLPQKQCPRCGKRHDFDYPKCPFCQFDYYA